MTNTSFLNIGYGGVGRLYAGGFGNNTVNVGGDSMGTVNADVLQASVFNVGTSSAVGFLNGSFQANTLNIGANGVINPTSAYIGVLNVTTGATLNLANSSITLDAGGIVNDPLLTIPSTATFQMSFGTFSNALTNEGLFILQADEPLVSTVKGDFTQSSTATLEISLATSPSYMEFYPIGDELVVDGTADLSGTLDVTAPSGFSFTVGESFQILSLASESGQFSNIELPLAARRFKLGHAGPLHNRNNLRRPRAHVIYTAGSGWCSRTREAPPCARRKVM